MNLRMKTLMAFALLAGLSMPALAVDNLLVDPGFEGPDYFGQGWGNWGNTSFNDFWAPDICASLFGDWWNNYGGVFQTGIAGQPATIYQFVLCDTRIEASWKADLYFGLEYYDVDDATKLGETMVLIDTATRLANGQINGNAISMQGTSVAGTAFVRPVFRFENVDPNYVVQPDAGTFVFNTFMSLAPALGQEMLKNPGFEDTDGSGRPGDFWGNWGTTDFNSFWGVNGHASFFADNLTNSGGVYQLGILGTPNARYQFDLADVRIEANWDADLYFGLEYYDAADFTKLGATEVLIDTSVTGDGLHFTMTGTAPAGTVYVRPYIRFDNVGYAGGSLRNAFVFGATLTELSPLFPGDLNCDGVISYADINPFVLALSGQAGYEARYPNCHWMNADVNSDGVVSYADINPFVRLLSK
jgi:hypothetical protein